MQIDSILYILYSNTSIIISITLAILFWYRRSATGAKWMTLSMVLAALWGASEFLSDMSNNNEIKLLWKNVSYFGISIIPVAWVAFTLEYTKNDKYLTIRNKILLFLIPSITFIIVWTNDFHHFMIADYNFIKTGQFVTLDLTFGWWGWVHGAYSYSLLLLGLIFLIKNLVTMPNILRSQAKIIIVAILAPFVVSLLYSFKLTPSYPINPSTFSFTFTGILCFWGMFRYKLFEMIPAARNAVIESMSQILFVLDKENNIIDINSSAKTIFDRKDRDVVGLPIKDLLGKWYSYFSRYENVLDVSEKISIEVENNRMYFDLKITPMFDSKNKVIGKFIILYDTTALEQAIANLEDSRKAAEDANKAKSQFLATMSHEIRTPLNGIIGMTELLTLATHTQEENGYLQSVQNCANSLLIIINDILDFSKIEAGKMELEKTGFNLRKLMEDEVKTFSLQKKAKDIEFVCSVDDAISRNLIGDPGRLRQVFVNLIGNAFKFTQKGKIELRVEPLSYENQHALLQFTVTDTGIGISEDKIVNLFKSFQQVDSSTTRKYGGTGLGLAIVKNLITIMGGHIEVESKLGEGSKFTFTIPFKTTETEVSQEIISPEFKFNNKEVNILLAEDNKVNQMFMAKLIEKQKLKVDIAENGILALQKLKEKNYDLILMDIQMPEMDGYEATQAIRKNETLTGKHIPIIAITANATEEDRNRCILTGMDDYLTKPIKSEKLYSCLAKYIK